MAKTKVKLRGSGMDDLLNDPGLAADLRRRAEAVLDAASASAPVADGDLRDSLSVVEDTTDRAVARVVASAPHARLVEARTGFMSAALDAAGG